jgi:cobalamin biosynthesis Mg chelatase CobN
MYINRARTPREGRPSFSFCINRAPCVHYHIDPQTALLIDPSSPHTHYNSKASLSTGPIVSMADNDITLLAENTENTEPQNPSIREFNSSADLSQLRNKGGSLTAQELQDLTARIQAQEELVGLEARMRALEDRERSGTLEQTHEPSKKRRQQATTPSDSSSSSEPSSSDSDSDTSSSDSGSDSSSSNDQRRHQKKHRTRGIKISPDYILYIDSSLREWGD